MDFTTIAAEIAEAYEPPEHGRHSVITDTVMVAEFLTAIERGNYLSTAADLAGIHENTIAVWLKRGEAGEQPYNRFQWAYKRALAHAEAQMVDCVRAAAQTGPQYWAAGMTYLERRQPDKWGKRSDEGNVPKVIVQVGTRAGDVQVNLGLSPGSNPGQSETLQITEQSATASDKPDYVNEPKLLTARSIAQRKRRANETKRRRAIRRGAPTTGGGLSAGGKVVD